MEEGTVKRGSATCPVTGFTTSADNVKNQFKGRQGGGDDARLLCVVLTNPKERGRLYRLPTKSDLDALNKAKEKIEELKLNNKEVFSLIPDEELPYLRSIFNIQLLGVNSWGSLFTSRQSLAFIILGNLIKKIEPNLINDDDHNFVAIIQTCLALNIGKIIDYNST